VRLGASLPDARSAILNEDLRGQDARAELHGGIYAYLSSMVAERIANKDTEANTGFDAWRSTN